MKKITIKNTALLLGLLASVFAFTSCDDDDGAEVLEQELITTVRLNLTEVATNTTSTFTIADLDGPGGNDPVVETVTVNAGQDYVMNVEFLDESGATVDDITEEVGEESNDHLICYTVTGEITGLTITDTDADGNPLGLVGGFTTGNAGDASLQVVLRHEPDKASTAPCSTGETDADVTFPVTVQ